MPTKIQEREKTQVQIFLYGKKYITKSFRSSVRLTGVLYLLNVNYVNVFVVYQCQGK